MRFLKNYMKTIMSIHKTALNLSFIFFLGFLAAYVIENSIKPWMETRPIIQTLSSKDMNRIQDVILQLSGYQVDPSGNYGRIVGHRRLSGHSARKVERKILVILEEVDDPDTLKQLFYILESPYATLQSKTGLDFGRYGDAEWDIIRSALDRYGKAVQDDVSAERFEVGRRFGSYFIGRIVE